MRLIKDFIAGSILTGILALAPATSFARGGGGGGGHFGGFHGGSGTDAWHHDGGWAHQAYSGYYGYYGPFDYGLDGYAGPYYGDSDSSDFQPASTGPALDEPMSLIMSVQKSPGSVTITGRLTSIAATDPVVSSSSEDSVRISSTNVVKANGGSYVTGMVEPLFGYAAPSAVQVSVAAYGASGKLLAEKVGEIGSDDLVITHLNPSPRAAYAVFLPWKPSQIAKVIVTEYSGHTHAS